MVRHQTHGGRLEEKLELVNLEYLFWRIQKQQFNLGKTNLKMYIKLGVLTRMELVSDIFARRRNGNSAKTLIAQPA